EQTLNKLLANAKALELMREDSGLRREDGGVVRAGGDFLGADSSGGKGGGPGSELLSTMPWVGVARKDELMHRQLIALLDTGRAAQAIGRYLERLYSLQDESGGMVWFDGGKPDAYISAYVLAGFGKLDVDRWSPGTFKKRRLAEFIERLVRY